MPTEATAPDYKGLGELAAQVELLKKDVIKLTEINEVQEKTIKKQQEIIDNFELQQIAFQQKFMYQLQQNYDSKFAKLMDSVCKLEEINKNGVASEPQSLV